MTHNSQGQTQESLPYYERCAEHLGAIRAAAPDELFYQERLQAEPKSLEELVQAGLEAAEQAVKLVDASAEYRQMLLDLQTILAELCMRQEDPPRALQVDDAMLESSPELAGAWRAAAELYAIASGLACTGEWLTSEERLRHAASSVRADRFTVRWSEASSMRTCASICPSPPCTTRPPSRLCAPKSAANDAAAGQARCPRRMETTPSRRARSLAGEEHRGSPLSASPISPLMRSF
ncbi:MAG: tetratricopeptide (TPR) repeat protein [Planctomycetota bacterium]|jgi:tetratricopeptide (TPR) repeat protein